MCWKIHDLELDAGDISHAVLSNGDIVLEVLFQISLGGRVAIFHGLHLQGPGANSLGVGGMRTLTGLVMEYLDVDELRIEGATRTTGAGPGRRPAPLVFRHGGHAGA